MSYGIQIFLIAYLIGCVMAVILYLADLVHLLGFKDAWRSLDKGCMLIMLMCAYGSWLAVISLLVNGFKKVEE